MNTAMDISVMPKNASTFSLEQNHCIEKVSQYSNEKLRASTFPATLGMNRAFPSNSTDISGKSKAKFTLSSGFIDTFKKKKPPFGFNGLGELVYMRTYSRNKVREDGTSTKEQWFETVERVVNGTYNIQKNWLESQGMEWNHLAAQQSAQKMYNKIFNMKFLPPGRGLWAMGSPITEERELYAALNNCAFVSTDYDDQHQDDPSIAIEQQQSSFSSSPAEPFCFLMEASMLGIGVGFDTKGAGKIKVKGYSDCCEDENHNLTQKEQIKFVISDSREGWVQSVRLLLESYFLGHQPCPEFDYSCIRPAGKPLKAFGGISSGPAPLKKLHELIHKTLRPLVGHPISSRGIVDIMNHIGVCVVSGNIRRTAEIAFGSYNDEDYISLKDYNENPDRAEYGWTSNNSIFAQIGMDYGPVCDRIRYNGEPGFAWLDNMQQYSRMNGVKDYRDIKAQGGNPCLEETLESYELCCLVETFPANHNSFEEYKETLQYAFLFAKTVTLKQTHWPKSNRVMIRNRRIGCSMSGIAQFISRHGLDELKKWCECGYDTVQHYDKLYSNYFGIPQSIKTTAIKPSGTVSLLAGATPGMHYPESRFYIRRVRLDKSSELIPSLIHAKYHVEPCQISPDKTVVVSIPVDVGENIRTVPEVSMWEQLSLAAFLQQYWADNQVSCTVTFNPETEGDQLQHALPFFQYKLKGVSFLPRIQYGAYPQMPYEEIAQDEYRCLIENLKPVDFSSTNSGEIIEEAPDQFCDSNKCDNFFQ